LPQLSAAPSRFRRPARVLAIAQGLPLVRAANTGISAVIDPVGRIINLLPLGVEGVLDSALPNAIEPTFCRPLPAFTSTVALPTPGTAWTNRINAWANDCAGHKRPMHNPSTNGARLRPDENCLRIRGGSLAERVETVNNSARSTL